MDQHKNKADTTSRISSNFARQESPCSATFKKDVQTHI